MRAAVQGLHAIEGFIRWHLYGCLSSANKHDLKDILLVDDNEAIAMLENKLISALGDKKLSAKEKLPS